MAKGGLKPLTEVPRDWRARWKHLGLAVRVSQFTQWTKCAKTMEDVALLEEMQLDLRMAAYRMAEHAKQKCPIGFFQPSWEQAQIINAWHPDFEPELSDGGYRSVCNFCANRIGKTVAMVIDTLLWIIPNDPAWMMFQPREDHLGRGEIRVWPRPDWEVWKQNGKMIYPWRDAPPKARCELWQGVVDDNHWHDKIGKEYWKWIPKDFIKRAATGNLLWLKADKSFETKWGHVLSAKSYNSDPMAWAGKAVWRINMDEGFTKAIFDEAMLRVESGGYFHWAYTPAEPRNIGQRTLLAWECWKGKHRLVGPTKFFINFKMEDAPDHIIPADKKADDIARLRQEGEMGKARMLGGFFESSPAVFSHFNRDDCVLPFDGPDLLKKHPDAVIVRGFDEGMASPSACIWTAILRTGEYVFFREWQESGLSVGDRCEAIIDRSGNKRTLIKLDPDDDTRSVYCEDFVKMRIRRTFGDSKMFKRDQTRPQDNWVENYRRAGLRIERASNIGPGARCDFLNDMFRADATRRHLTDPQKPGRRVYITRDCPQLIERMENYLWSQIQAGPNKGQFTDKPETKDDHIIDSATYTACSKLRWIDMEEVMARVAAAA